MEATNDNKELDAMKRYEQKNNSFDREKSTRRDVQYEIR